MALAAYLERTLARVRDVPVDLALLPPNVTAGTIFSGATGVALFFAEVVRLRGGDESLLAVARRWLDAADEWARRATPDDWRRLPRGFVFGQTGIAYVDALLSAASGDRARVHAAVERIERAADRFDDLNDTVRASGVVGGEAGIVLATRDLLVRLPTHDDYATTRALLQRIHDRALASLLALHASPFDPRPEALTGMAHGIAGELFVLVSSGLADHVNVKARLDELVQLKQVDPNGHVYWLERRDSEDAPLVASWCNGTTGHAFLWSEVARRTGSAEARGLAAECARSTAFLLTASPGICCGLAGQSIVLQRFAELSGETKYARLAYARLRRATQIADASPPGAFGFWQGALGVAFVALARLRGERAFPCMESPPPPRALALASIAPQPAAAR